MGRIAPTVTVVKRIGKCRRCGKCCKWENGIILTTIWEANAIAPMHKGKQFVVNSRRDVVHVMSRLGFDVLAITEIRGDTRDWRCWSLKVRCRNVTERGCAIHKRKPYFCAAYPASPSVRKFKGCGFRWRKMKRIR